MLVHYFITNRFYMTAEQTDDMKIKIKVAKFDTSKISDLRFENDELPVSTYKTIQSKHIQTKHM